MAFLADPRLRQIAPEKLERWVDRPVRHAFPRLERAVVATARALSGEGRPLFPDERDVLVEVFGDTLQLDPVRVVETRWLNAPTVLGNTIRVRPRYELTGRNRPVLVHEAVHLWQFQHFGTRYITDSIYHNVRAMIRTGRRSLAYMNYQLHVDSRLSDFSVEQQATIIADHYELTHLYAAVPHPPAWVTARRDALPIYQRLLEEVRNTTHPSNA